MESKHSLIWVGHNEKAFHPAISYETIPFPRMTFSLTSTISPVIIKQLAALIYNSFYVNASDLGLTSLIRQLIKWDNYILDTQVKNLWYAVTRFHIAWHCKYFCHSFRITSVETISYSNQINPQSYFPFLIKSATGFALYISFMLLKLLASKS